MFRHQMTAETALVAGGRLQISNLRSEICRTRLTVRRLHAASLAAVVLTAVGCTDHDAREAIATRVILPGEQSFTVPEVPEDAVPATSSEASRSANEAAGNSTSNIPSTTASNSPVSTPSTGAPSESSTAAPAATTGTDKALFSGRVTVAGTPPTLSPLMNKGNPNVKDAVCVAQDVPDESLVVGDGGGLANVFVYAKKVPSGVEVPPAPSEPVVMDQQNCRFVPQAMVFRVGQPLLMKNSDPVSHNVRASGLTQSINQIISPGDQTGIPVTYKRTERVPVQTKCDIHAWMSAYHFPLDHPWAAVTGPDGTFEIKDLPPGEWEFVVWHGRTGFVEKSVKFNAAAGQVVSMDFSVPAADLSP